MNTYTCKKCGWSGEVNGRPRCLACYRAKIAEWRAKNPEKAKEQKKRYERKFRDERPDEYNAKRRKYRLPETVKKAWERRIAWLNEGTVTRDDLKEIAALYGFKCVYCGGKINLRYNPKDPRGFDHVKPRSRGGKHERSNIVTCCGRCNALKGG